jgi:hypothetical protein
MRLIRHEKNSGLPALRANEGVLAAKGKYIAFAFDDDVWYENTLDDLYSVITSDTSIDAVYGIDKYYRQEGMEFELFSDSYGGRDFSSYDIKVSNYIPCNAFLIKKESMIELGLFTPHILIRRIADWDFWVRAAGRLKIRHAPILCGEMYETQNNSLTRICEVDTDLLSRFATFYNLYNPSIKTYKDLANYPIDYLPTDLTNAFSRQDILSFETMMNLFFDQTNIPCSANLAPLVSKASDITMRAGLFEIGQGFSPELVHALSRYGSVRYLSPEVPLSDIQKSNMILFDSFSPELLDSSYHKGLRLWMNYICLGSQNAVPDHFGDISIIDPAACDMATIAERIANLFHQKSFVSIDSSKFLTLGRILSDVINIIDHAKRSRRKNPVVNHINEVLRTKP